MNDGNGNGNTIKYRIEKLEESSNKNELELEKYKAEQNDLYRNVIAPFVAKMNTLDNFIEEHKPNIRELQTMKNTIQRKEEQDKWMFRLLVAVLLTGIIVPILMKYVG